MRFLILAAVAAALSVAVAPAGAVPTRSITLGSTFTVTGLTGSATGPKRAVGVVVVTLRWGNGPWRRFETTRTNRDGRYQLTLHPHRRGALNVRIAPPDRHVVRYLLRVL
jgi:hypothetical protein